MIQRFRTWDELKDAISEMPAPVPAQYMTTIYAEYIAGEMVSYILSVGELYE